MGEAATQSNMEAASCLLGASWVCETGSWSQIPALTLCSLMPHQPGIACMPHFTFHLELCPFCLSSTDISL